MEIFTFGKTDETHQFQFNFSIQSKEKCGVLFRNTAKESFLVSAFDEPEEYFHKSSKVIFQRKPSGKENIDPNKPYKPPKRIPMMELSETKLTNFQNIPVMIQTVRSEASKRAKYSSSPDDISKKTRIPSVQHSSKRTKLVPSFTRINPLR